MNVTLGNVGSRVCCGITHRGFESNSLLQNAGDECKGLVTVTQVHGTSVVVLPEKGTIEFKEIEACQADGIVTNRDDVLVAVKVADCCGVVLYDPETQCIGVAHSGWRGTAKGTVTATIMQMVHTYGADPWQMRAWLSASASRDAYQVGVDVHSVLGRFCVPDPASRGRWLFDNHKAIRHELASCGISQEHVTECTDCTITNERYHSFRRDGARAGRGLVFARLRNG